jgi:transcriptional regulator GlxA family with amidase domain
MYQINLCRFKKSTLLYVFVGLVLASCSNGTPTIQKDSKHSDKESCPEKDPLNPNSYNVAFLIMDGTFNTELTAPYDIFHHTKFRDSIKAMNVFTVSDQSVPVKTFEGLRILPDYNFLTDQLPNIDILIVPSAEHHLDSDLDNKKMIDFVRETSKTAKYTISHCDGAFILAKAGILKDKVCTTFPGDIGAMRNMFPSLDIRENVLFVHDGNVISSAGGAKSFEASLYLCELLYGKQNADDIAEGMVIDWNLNEQSYFVVK